MKPIRIAADNAADASRLYLSQRRFSSLPPEAFPPGDWQGKYISQDGIVWQSEADPLSLFSIPPIFHPTGGYTPDPVGHRQEIDRQAIAAFYAARAAREGRE